MQVWAMRNDKREKHKCLCMYFASTQWITMHEKRHGDSGHLVAHVRRDSNKCMSKMIPWKPWCGGCKSVWSKKLQFYIAWTSTCFVVYCRACSNIQQTVSTLPRLPFICCMCYAMYLFLTFGSYFISLFDIFLCVLFLHYCFRRWLWWWSVLSLPSPLSLSLLSALVNVVVFLLIFVLININKTIARCAVNLCVQMYTVTWWHAKGQKKCDR